MGLPEMRRMRSKMQFDGRALLDVSCSTCRRHEHLSADSANNSHAAHQRFCGSAREYARAAHGLSRVWRRRTSARQSVDRPVGLRVGHHRGRVVESRSWLHRALWAGDCTRAGRDCGVARTSTARDRKEHAARSGRRAVFDDVQHDWNPFVAKRVNFSGAVHFVPDERQPNVRDSLDRLSCETECLESVTKSGLRISENRPLSAIDSLHTQLA
jgi:hypothetical protein